MMATNVRTGAKKRKKTKCRMSTLHLEDVDVILYDFTLTKSRHLRKSMIVMLQAKLKTTSERQTRSKTLNLIDVGLHLDEDNALINSSEEDESSCMGGSDSISCEGDA